MTWHDLYEQRPTVEGDDKNQNDTLGGEKLDMNEGSFLVDEDDDDDDDDSSDLFVPQEDEDGYIPKKKETEVQSNEPSNYDNNNHNNESNIITTQNLELPQVPDIPLMNEENEGDINLNIIPQSPSQSLEMLTQQKDVELVEELNL